MNNISEDQHPKNTRAHGLVFIREVVKYFMDFLETDFHKRRNPKRTVKFRNDSNLLIGVDLSKYPKFKKLVYEAIHQGFHKSTISRIQRGVYRANIPADLLQLTKLQCQRLTEQQIDKLLDIIAAGIVKVASDNKEYDRALIMALESAQTIIKSELVHPFIMFLEKPLQNLSLGDEDAVYLMEGELASIFCKALEDKIAAVVRLLILGEKPDVKRELAFVFNLEEVTNDIDEFFEGYQVKDLYAELYEIYRNKNILDKQDTYLYFYDISFQNTKYPIFYIPFNVEKETDTLKIEFDSQVYINKKALEYIGQQYNELSNRKGSLKTIGERIIYLSQHKNDFSPVVSSIINEITDFFELDFAINTSDFAIQVAKSSLIKVSNSCYINLSEKSDEALINDYEEILQLLSQEDSILGEAFNGLIDDFIRKEPTSFNGEIADEWDDKEIGDKLVFETPVPLNSEQRQILAATKKKGCKYITVEGPPGTGKSHTITAIVCDAILNDQSVLVLSDKKEALDVVEDKITQTMDQVRYEKNFQNPILRLGKTGNTYSQILSSGSIDNINVYHRVLKRSHETLLENINKSVDTLKEYLEAEVLAYDGIDILEIRELIELESYYTSNNCLIDFEEASSIPNSAVLIEDLRELMRNLHDIFADRIKKVQSDKLFELLGSSVADFKNLNAFCDFLDILAELVDCSRQLVAQRQYQVGLLDYFHEFSDAHIEKLNLLVMQYEKCRNRLFGYFLKSARVERLNREFKEAFPRCKFEEPHKCLKQLHSVLDFLKLAISLKSRFLKDSEIDYLRALHGLFKDNTLIDLAEEFVDVSEDIRFLEQNIPKYPETLKNLQIDLSKLPTLWDNLLLRSTDNDFNKMIRYISLNEKVTQAFNAIEPLDYGASKKKIEELVTFQMTYLLDGRVVDFYDHNRATAKALGNIIRNKGKFPKDEFARLKNAFPCILAGIRDYAEYIPLAPEIFDLVIIDEASQVSVAQAFPALLRAKKVVVLGDKKQFSNVKAAQARTDTNIEYLNNLERSFRENVSQDPIKLVKLQKFNIKTSILEFFGFITNYNTRLLKHFRGYKELISYSNKYFYGDLQVMKIRGKPIDDTLKFTFVKHDGKKELSRNTNKPEIDFIISELQQLKAKENNATVGLITPHTNQQKLAMEMISKIPDKDYYFDTNKLKIMTFDTCQGEERDIIFYSMVATEESDRLWGVFIKDLANVDLEEEPTIKAQRLNVGFSRAKECIHLVLSKSLDNYSGAIGVALRHYHKTLTDARSERTAVDVDQRSAMESAVLNWFYQTGFWKENRDNTELIPGFEIGKYLRQLDKTYMHPNYVVDFLLIYRNGNREHKIIIEYDGFKEHFQDTDARNEFRHDYYYSEADVYREKVLESYGYKFLRINKFNIGTNPITTLDTRIKSLTKDEPPNTKFLSSVHETVEAFQNGSIRQCPKCEETKNIEDFRDTALLSGYGRICNQCKKIKRTESRPATRVAVKRMSTSTTYVAERTLCPICGSRMVLRNGRYGRFWGCSQYPYCRGTRHY
jgi:ssDNA-binding Zn-finger/Zn-ribbon topoisomerase 1/very-short-patch-repair endonuclease